MRKAFLLQGGIHVAQGSGVVGSVVAPWELEGGPR